MTILSQTEKARQSALELQGYSQDDKNKMLSKIADGILNNQEEILKCNKIDLDNMQDKQSVFYERLTLTPQRIKNMVDGVRQIISLPDPVGKVTSEWTRPSGIKIKKVRSPLGVIGIIYEARPNVTVDATALCIKSGNAVVLRGSKGAINSNRILYQIMQQSIKDAGFNPDCVQFIDDPSHEAVGELLKQDKYIDVIIPRGGEGLKKFVLENTKIPVIASAGGNCHTYIEKSANLEKAVDVIINAKCQRPSVCNALEHLLVDSDIANEFIPVICEKLKQNNITIYGDDITYGLVNGIERATDELYQHEFEDLKITISVVKNVYEAVNHINKYGTRHSEAIITEDKKIADIFTTLVDCASVYVNVSTRFTDGFEFGFGAEMGISTGKLHARGPLGLEQLTSERYIIDGEYITRS